MRLEERVNTYGNYLKQRYGQRVFRVGLSTGFECPHRLSTGGCIFCLPETYTDSSLDKPLSPERQLAEIIPKVKRGVKIPENTSSKFLAYFHSGTATYGDPELLHKIFSDT